MTLRVHRSNRLERLVEILRRIVAQTPTDAITPEVIVVQSKGMERWLSLTLADSFGIWANARFPFPRTFVSAALDAVVGADDGETAYERQCLAWSIAALLPRLATTPPFSPIHAYLAGPDSEQRLLELARRIAHGFDQYSVYRPELLLRWQEAPDDDWQGELWRALVERHGPAHLAGRVARFFEVWPALDAVPPELPRRVSIFGVSSLPPIYVKILAALSERIDVHLFCLSPTREWASDPGERTGLFETLGGLGREFQRVLEESAHYDESTDDLFVDPGTETMLATLQSDVLALRRRGSDQNAPKKPVAANDDSIVLHACHSPMREVEVLRDQLLAFFERDPSLAPHEIVVMTPDIDKYAPLIDAVFGFDPSEPGFLPYRIADRVVRSENAVADALVHTLTLIGSRMKASEVLDVLEFDPVRLRFEFSVESLAEVSRLVRKAGIRWGIDAEHRRSAGQPARADNTWRFGLDRLLMGYAAEGRDRDLFLGVLPVDDIAGDHAGHVGRLAELIETLIRWRSRLSTPRSPVAWTRELSTLVDDLFEVPENRIHELRAVRDVLADIAEQSARGGFSDAIDLATLTVLLRERFETERNTHDFLTGGVTFCALLPMRSVPFRVVCLLGMNDADFPRRDRSPSFDKIAERPRPGDRSTRDEDRYLFLEALLSARERLVLSYVGRGVQDNAEYPPSVVVAEVKDALDASFVSSRTTARQLALPFSDAREDAGVGDAIVVEHPLQPFSPRYFGADPDPRLFSYSEPDALGARALCFPSESTHRFQHAPLIVEEPQGGVTIDELARFFENPARALLQTRLGVYLEEDPLLVEDREPLALDPLDAYSVGALLLERALTGEDLQAALEAIRAQGVLPLGTPGDVALTALLPEVQSVAALAAPWIERPRLEPLPVEVDVHGFVIRGSLADVYEKAQVRRQFSRVKARTELAFWIRHLALQCVPEPSPRTSVLIGRSPDPRASEPCMRRYLPLERERALAVLADLVLLFRLGQRAPLCLFPTASKYYVECVRKYSGQPDADVRALDGSRRAFAGSAGADAVDAYVQRLFTGVDPFADNPVPFDEESSLGLPAFADLAERVFGPMLDGSETEGALP